MVFRRILLGGVAAVTLGTGLACPSLAQAADTPRTLAAQTHVGFAHAGIATEDERRDDRRDRDDEDGVKVEVNGNNNGGNGGDSTGATANDNGHIHDITGGGAKAGSQADAKADADGKAWAMAHAGDHRHHEG